MTKPTLKKVIHLDNLPSRFPGWALATVYLLLDKWFDVPGWGWGVLATLVTLVFVGWFGELRSQVQVKLPGYGEVNDLK